MNFSESKFICHFWLFQKQLYICKFPAERCGQNQSNSLTAKTLDVAYENNDKKLESIYSKRIRAGKRRTYFFDVRATRGNDYYLTITESRKRFDDNGYDRHKIFLYKEDFNKFIKALGEAVDYVKTELMPDFDFDAFNHDEVLEEGAMPVMENEAGEKPVETPVEKTPEITGIADAATNPGNSTEEVDKW